MSEIKIENLDDSFFEDLREGNFILVLGAGFSFGVPNKAGGTIPIGNEFKKITKKRFNDKSATDYQSAAQVWRTKIRGDGDLLDELKNHFLVNEKKIDKNLYSSIFIPQWYNIYTLNFDNVLDIALKEFPSKKYQKFCYPKDNGGSYKPDIFHLHGEIENILDIDSELIFTPESYTKFDTEVPHDLYDVLHSDVKTLHKKILILGSQFKEPEILKKFFKTLPEDKSVKIYHLDIENYNLHSDNFAKCDTTFVKLDKAKGGTKHFLQFLQANKDRIENIHIEGTEIINSSFEKKISEGKKFKKADFFTAKLEDDCQWYGIINKYDIEREDYPKVKELALHCFDKPQTLKVCALVYGFGGCGKSTLLRRLAVELRNESFKTIWLQNQQFDLLADSGLTQIQADRTRNYLVIIEDWYRITANEKTKEFLLKTQSIPNLRVIIGDREITHKEYLNNLPKGNNKFHLEARENKKIILDILSQHTEWEPAAKKVIKKEEDYNTTLYLLLFVIARISSEDFGDEIDFSEPATAFESIVKSDLNKINDAGYSGLAKVLYNWACIYTNYKIFIDYSSFLKIADAYNGDDKISKLFKNWNANSEILNRLKNYIHIGTNTEIKNKKLHTIEFVQFNHDKLAEEGLAEAALKGWESFYDTSNKKYNEPLLLDFLDKVIEYSPRGNDYFSSFFLHTLLQYQKHIFLNADEKLNRINNLYNKNNYYPSYLNHLTDDDINLSESESKKYLYELFDKKSYPIRAWSSYFKKANAIAKHEAAIKIFDAFNDSDAINTFNEQLVTAAFNQKGYDVKSEEENKKSKQEIAIAKHEAAIKILAAPDITLLVHNIVVAAFNQKGYDEKSKQEIVKAKHEAAFKIFAAPDITLLQPEIVVAAFNQEGYDEKSKQEIVKAKHEAAIKILKDYDWDRKKDTMMFQALRFFSTEATYPSRVNELVTEIINQFHQHKSEKDSLFYYQRLNMIVGYPFHNIPLWKGNGLYYISNWRDKKTINFFVKVLHSFRSHPDEIKAVCEQILKNWKREVTIEIRQIYGEAHKGDHIRLALGHPDLREIALTAAKEMVTEEDKNPNTLPGYLLEIVLRIVQEKPEFPEWNKNTENESNTQQSE